MRLTIGTSEGRSHHATAITVGVVSAVIALSTRGAAAHIMPWQDRTSRTIALVPCAKWPRQKPIDISPSVRHVHRVIDGGGLSSRAPGSDASTAWTPCHGKGGPDEIGKLNHTRTQL